MIDIDMIDIDMTPRRCWPLTWTPWPGREWWWSSTTASRSVPPPGERCWLAGIPYTRGSTLHSVKTCGHNSKYQFPFCNQGSDCGQIKKMPQTIFLVFLSPSRRYQVVINIEMCFICEFWAHDPFNNTLPGIPYTRGSITASSQTKCLTGWTLNFPASPRSFQGKGGQPHITISSSQPQLPGLGTAPTWSERKDNPD